MVGSRGAGRELTGTVDTSYLVAGPWADRHPHLVWLSHPQALNHEARALHPRASIQQVQLMFAEMNEFLDEASPTLLQAQRSLPGPHASYSDPHVPTETGSPILWCLGPSKGPSQARGVYRIEKRSERRRQTFGCLGANPLSFSAYDLPRTHASPGGPSALPQGRPGPGATHPPHDPRPSSVLSLPRAKQCRAPASPGPSPAPS